MGMKTAKVVTKIVCKVSGNSFDGCKNSFIQPNKKVCRPATCVMWQVGKPKLFILCKISLERVSAEWQSGGLVVVGLLKCRQDDVPVFVFKVGGENALAYVGTNFVLRPKTTVGKFGLVGGDGEVVNGAVHKD